MVVLLVGLHEIQKERDCVLYCEPLAVQVEGVRFTLFVGLVENSHRVEDSLDVTETLSVLCRILRRSGTFFCEHVHRRSAGRLQIFCSFELLRLSEGQRSTKT